MIVQPVYSFAGSDPQHPVLSGQPRGTLTNLRQPGLRAEALRREIWTVCARMHRDERLTSLLHYVDVDRLRESFYSLKRKSAAGSDGLQWMDYQEGLGERLVYLHSRIHDGRYHAKPARRTTIPKADGGERMLSIWCLEDKIVQQAIVTVLNAVYE